MLSDGLIPESSTFGSHTATSAIVITHGDKRGSS